MVSFVNLRHSSPRGLSCAPLFQTVTPFRMDDEARALAKRMLAASAPACDTSEQQSRRRNKRRKLSATDSDPETNHVRQQYERFCRHLRAKFFPGAPTVAEIAANNQFLRRHVASRMTAVEEALLRMRDQLPSSGGNATSDVMEQNGILLPPGSKYIQR